MSKTMQRPPQGGRARPSLQREDPPRFAARLKRWSVGFAAVGFGLTWGLVSHNVVGATNAPTTATTTSAAAPTSGRAAVPSTDFFGQPNVQPQPILGNGSAGQGQAPIVRGRTS
jgi:hypothetical protein